MFRHMQVSCFVGLAAVCQIAVAQDGKQVGPTGRHRQGPSRQDLQQHFDGLIQQLLSLSFDEREQAVKELQREGTRALNSLYAARKLRDPDVARNADRCIAFIKIQEEVADSIGLLKTKGEHYWGVRAKAAMKLGELGVAAETSVPALLEAIDDEHGLVRTYSIAALGHIGPAAREAIPSLIGILRGPKNDYYDLRVFAADALGRIGAADAIPDLIKAVKDPEPLLRLNAAAALGKVAANNPDVVTCLAALLKDSDQRVISGAADSLGKLREQPDKAVPALITAIQEQRKLPAKDWLRHDSPVSHLVSALGLFGPDAASAVPELVTVLGTSPASSIVTSPVHQAAILALERIGPKAKQAEPILKELALKGRYSAIYSESALRALNAIGSKHQ